MIKLHSEFEATLGFVRLYLKKVAGVSRTVAWSISEMALSTEGTSGPCFSF